MKRLALLLLGIAFISGSARAEDQTRSIQSELKEQGFYFGEIDGATGPAFSAALKRYQIRNGLEVTGQPNAETLAALGIGGRTPPATAKSAPAPSEAVPARRPPAAAPQRPAVDLRKNQETVESDRRALDESTRRYSGDPSIVPPPANPDRPPYATGGARYAEIYAGTPFERAPLVLQEQTLRAAQRFLANQGFYRDPVDGDPGPATEEAVLSYQRAHHFPLTGRLDMETLNALRLLPGPGSANPGLKPFTAPRAPSRVYRGVWVQ